MPVIIQKARMRVGADTLYRTQNSSQYQQHEVVNTWITQEDAF